VNYHFIIGGGGIVGLSTAWHLQQHYPARKLLLLEKESALARQQAKNSASSMEFHAGGSGGVHRRTSENRILRKKETPGAACHVNHDLNF